MLYLIDTAPWTEADLRRECAAHGIEFRSGFHFVQTCTRLASHLVKQQIAHDFGTKGALAMTARGKPYFDDGAVHFNVTHHGRLVLAVASATQPVGIDLTDQYTPFVPAELAQLFKEVPAHSLEGYYWAAREAYLKYTGEGTHEAPLNVQKPAHTAVPDLERLSAISVMPFMKVERTFVRLFKVRDFVGAVVAPRADVAEIRCFSSETQVPSENEEAAGSASA